MTQSLLKLDQLEARIEDAEYMADHGETIENAAARLGLKKETLRKWLRDNAPHVADKFKY